MVRLAIIPPVIALLFGGMASAQTVADEEASAAKRPRKMYTAPLEERDAWKQDVLVALVGGGARLRRIDLDVGDLAGGSEMRRLDTGAYFDFGWHVLIRPMGQRSPRPSVRAVILQVDGGSGFAVRVQREDSGISLDTNVWRLLGQVGYLYPFGRLLFGGLVGVGGDVFNIDLNSVLPSSRIVYARLGPAVEYALIDDFLKLRADFGTRFPFRVGEIEDAFGKDSSAFGLDATLTLGGRIEAGFTYAFRFIWEWYSLRFAGAFEDVPAGGDGGRGTDNAIDVQFLLGWSL